MPTVKQQLSRSALCSNWNQDEITRSLRRQQREALSKRWTQASPAVGGVALTAMLTTRAALHLAWLKGQTISNGAFRELSDGTMVYHQHHHLVFGIVSSVAPVGSRAICYCLFCFMRLKEKHFADTLLHHWDCIIEIYYTRSSSTLLSFHLFAAHTFSERNTSAVRYVFIYWNDN